MYIMVVDLNSNTKTVELNYLVLICRLKQILLFSKRRGVMGEINMKL